MYLHVGMYYVVCIISYHRTVSGEGCLSSAQHFRVLFATQAQATSNKQHMTSNKQKQNEKASRQREEIANRGAGGNGRESKKSQGRNYYVVPVLHWGTSTYKAKVQSISRTRIFHLDCETLESSRRVESSQFISIYSFTFHRWRRQQKHSQSLGGGDQHVAFCSSS